jgi:hypothetical protein
MRGTMRKVLLHGGVFTYPACQAQLRDVPQLSLLITVKMDGLHMEANVQQGWEKNRSAFQGAMRLTCHPRGGGNNRGAYKA